MDVALDDLDDDNVDGNDADAAVVHYDDGGDEEDELKIKMVMR